MTTSDLHDNILGQFEEQVDVGVVWHPGSCAYDPEQQTYTIASAGANIWGDHDDFHFVWKRITGDFIVTTRGSLLGEGINPHRKLGWMARTRLDTGSPCVCTGIHGDGLLTLQFRREQGGETEEVRSPLKGADVIQLERKGATYIMSVARFGEPFTAVQVAELSLSDELYVGLYVCSHENDIVETAVFGDVRIVMPAKKGFNRERDPFGSRLELLTIANGNRQVIYSEDHVFEAPNWTHDGKALIYNRYGRLYRFDLETKTPSLIDTGSVVRNNNDHVISFDGSMLAISSHSENDYVSRVYVVPLQGGEPKFVTPSGPSYLHGWSPDGKFLVYCAERGGNYDVYRISVDGGEETRLTAAIGLDDGPEYTPDGEYIYFNSVRSGKMQIWRMMPDGSAQEQMTNDEFNNWFPHISPDGQWVVFISYLVGEVEPGDHPAAKRVYIRLMPRNGGTPKVLAYLYGGQGSINVPSWSPDGTRLAFVSNTVPFE